MNTFDLETLHDTILDATESIIAETENVEDGFTGDMLDVIHFSDIRSSGGGLKHASVKSAEIKLRISELLRLLKNH